MVAGEICVVAGGMCMVAEGMCGGRGNVWWQGRGVACMVLGACKVGGICGGVGGMHGGREVCVVAGGHAWWGVMHGGGQGRAWDMTRYGQ